MAIPLQVLILEDREEDVEILLHELRSAGFDPNLRHADNERDYESLLAPELDVILADYTLPQFDALRALQILQARRLDVPFIVVTGSTTEDAPVKCMKSGATDYLIKDRLARLGPAITQALEARKEHVAKLQAEGEILRRNKQLTLLNSIIASSAGSIDAHSFLQTACDQLASALSSKLVFAGLLDEERTSIRIVAQNSAFEVFSVERVIRNSPMETLLTELKDPIVVRDLGRESRATPLHQVLASRGIRDVALLPLTIESQIAGFLGLTSIAGEQLDDEKLALGRSVAAELASAASRFRLEHERNRLITVIEQISEAVVVTDTNGHVAFANPSFERISGYTQAESIGRSFRMISGCSEDEGFFQDVRSTAQAQGAWRGRIVNTRKGGQPYTVELSFSSIRDRDGKVANFVGVLRDITDELEMEKRYLQAQKMEAVGRLAGGVAHDFNNLLTTIIGCSDLLSARKHNETSGQAELQLIREAADQAAALTRQLLAFSRKQVLLPRAVNLNEVILETKKMLGPLMREDVELRITLHTDLWLVKADPVQMVQVIMNLAVNARDAMPHGGVLSFSSSNVELSEADALQHPEIRPGSYVQLAVEDTGDGIHEDVLPHIFEPFFTTKEEGRGTGLGLSTVYGIVKQTGGHVSLTSQLGRGTVFRILLPRLLEEPEERHATTEAKTPSHGTETVLLVEDNDMVRGIVHKVLVSSGYTVFVARSADEALNLKRNDTRMFDLLITDVVMPGLSGLELAKRFRVSAPALKVLFMSGYTDASIGKEASLLPHSAFLQKPFAPTTLTAAVRAILES